MRIDLKNFFKYYDEKLSHHQDAIDELEKALLTAAPELLDDASKWVQTYRNKPEPKPEVAELVLPVPYYPQTDNYTQPERTCNSSACAMALEYFRPGTLKGPKGDDAYLREVFSVGDSVDHWAQTKVLAEYGVQSEFVYNLCFADLDRELSKKRPVVIGILHRGSLKDPYGGHIIIVIGKNTNGDYIVHDPYGDLYDGYTGNVYKGKSAVYEKSVLEARWTVEGPMSGWGRIFSAKVEEQKSESGKLPQAGVELVKEFEGLHQLGGDGMVHAYPDPLSGGLPYTIGYGSTKDIDGSPFDLGDKITREKAELLLTQQLKYNYLATLEKTIPYWDEMNDNQHGALLSFAYNLGANFYGSPDFNTITRVLRDKSWAKVPDALYLYRNPGTSVEEGLARRRIAEGDLWES
jgi:GH24 family phage-related lysozyme (muramidase)